MACFTSSSPHNRTIVNQDQEATWWICHRGMNDLPYPPGPAAMRKPISTAGGRMSPCRCGTNPMSLLRTRWPAGYIFAQTLTSLLSRVCCAAPYLPCTCTRAPHVQPYLGSVASPCLHDLAVN